MHNAKGGQCQKKPKIYEWSMCYCKTGFLGHSSGVMQDFIDYQLCEGFFLGTCEVLIYLIMMAAPLETHFVKNVI